jgi:hypothetical protein
MQFGDVAPILRALRERVERPFSIADFAAELGEDQNLVEQRLHELRSAGLVLLGGDPDDPPFLMRSAEQYLELHGEVDRNALYFLPGVIDDLHARAALFEGGGILVDEFRAAIFDGGGIEYAKNIVPPAFVEAMNDWLALNLFAASVALMARLSAEEPAGCVAEEVLAVAVMDEAETWLEMRTDQGELSEAAAKAAAGELRGLFELFQDDDVLNMFEMTEPADAALAGHSEINQQMGVADQRLEAWFKPFGWVRPTGYLGQEGIPPGPGAEEE